MTPLVMIRHGPTAWNEDKRLQGHTDVPLSNAGREIVSRWRVPPPVDQYHWVCSPLRRAVETATLLGAQAPDIEPRIKEMDYGNWEGYRLQDLRAELGREMSENESRGLDFRPEAGESPREVQARLTPWLVDVAALGTPTLAVAHHGILRVLYSMATGWNMADALPEKFQWSAMHCFFVADDGAVRVDHINVSLEAE